MSQYVTDTHAIIWHLVNDRRLSSRARQVFTETDAGRHQVFIPSIVMVEAIYLAERQRIDSTVLTQLLALSEESPTNYQVIPLDMEVIQALRATDRTLVPELPDRIIVATALLRGLQLVTRDSAIATSGIVAVLW